MKTGGVSGQILVAGMLECPDIEDLEWYQGPPSRGWDEIHATAKLWRNRHALARHW
jgi:hypothetical protein